MKHPNAQRRIDHKLSEGKRVGVLYHWTRRGHDGFDGIMSDNAFKGSKRRGEYISFTRDKTFTFIGPDRTPWRFTVDGDKISEKFKIGPYADDEMGWSRYGSEAAEAEERVSLKPGQTLGPLNRYVLEIGWYGPISVGAAVEIFEVVKEVGREAAQRDFGFRPSEISDAEYVAEGMEWADKYNIPFDWTP